MDKDVSRLVVEKAAGALLRTKRSVQAAIPYGPSKVKMTPAELRKAVLQASPDATQRLLQYLGPQQALSLLLGARQGLPPTLTDFVERNDASNTSA